MSRGGLAAERAPTVAVAPQLEWPLLLSHRHPTDGCLRELKVCL